MSGRDEGVSELLGYAVLAGVVIVAVVCIGSGVGGTISLAAESASFDEAGMAIRSFGATASGMARTNNTFYTASEIEVPAGYELIVLDSPDDFARFAVYSGGQEIFAAGSGSIRLHSPFRSAVWENGAVFCNDSGMVTIVRKPSIFIMDGSLYLFLTPVSASTSVLAGSRSAVIDVRAASEKNISRTVEGPVTITVTSSCPDGWSAVFRESGFSVAQEGNKVTATRGGISYVCVECRTLQVRVK